jgi:SAM-dependent methyltransferase
MQENNISSSPERENELLELGSPDRFGFEWRTYKELLPLYEEQFRRWTIPLEPADWKGKIFLDVGCGMGRNSYWPMIYGAAGGKAIDVDLNSLASAKMTLSRFATVTVEQLSIYDLTSQNEFDIVFSIGVIHHLANPGKALAQMVAAAKPGGRVLIWVYGLENNRWIVRLFDPLRKVLFSRMPIRLVHALSIFPASLLWLLVRCGLGGTEYFRLLKRFTFRHLRSIVFDQMLPRTARYYSEKEVRELMAQTGLEDIQLHWVNQISWAAVGVRPTAV